MYVALQCWGGSECGSRSYAGNVSLCSARTGLEKPTTLFKEMAVRGPSAALFASSFLSFPLVNATFLSLYNYFPLCKKGLYAYLLGRSSTHLHTRRQVYVPTTHWWCGLGNCFRYICDLNRDAALVLWSVKQQCTCRGGKKPPVKERY